MSWLESLRTLLAALLVIVTVLPLWRYDAWWVRACDFPRTQITILGLLLLVSCAARLPSGAVGRAFMALLVLAVMFQAHKIWHYTPLAPKQVAAAAAPRPGAHLSLMVANVLMDNRRLEGLLESVRRYSPDLVFTVETDAWWEQHLSELDIEYPHSIKQPLENTYGMMLHSRLELIDPRVEFLVETDVPSIHTRVRLPGGDRVQLHLLHPKPPHPFESLETTERDGELLMVGRQVGSRDEPTIVAGDLNDVAWSYTTRLLQRVSGLLDPRIGRGLFSSYNAKIPLLRWPLDHVFHSHHFKLLRLRRLPAFGSDHFPVLVELNLDPLAPLVQEEPKPTAEELETVEEKIEEAEPLQELDESNRE